MPRLGFHGRAWLVWLLAAIAPALLTKNPLYLAIAVGALAINHRLLIADLPGTAPWRVFLRFGLFLAAFAVLVPVLFSKAGETLLFTLPEIRVPLPSSAPTALGIGGPVSLESVVYGLSNGLALIAIILAFTTFNALVDHYQLLRALPRFLTRSAAALTVAVTFVPQMLEAQKEIREAQALRGHRFRGVRDLLPLLVGLLAEGLERSLAVAESMEARGFGREDRKHRPQEAHRRRRDRGLNGTLAAGVLCLLTGAFQRSVAPDSSIGNALMAVGTVVVAVAFWATGRRIRRSRYRVEAWRRRDSAVIAGALLSLVLTAGIWILLRESLSFYPYPRLPRPPFSLLFAVSLPLLATPALVARLGDRRESRFPVENGNSRRADRS